MPQKPKTFTIDFQGQRYEFSRTEVGKLCDAIVQDHNAFAKDREVTGWGNLMARDQRSSRSERASAQAWVEGHTKAVNRLEQSDGPEHRSKATTLERIDALEGIAASALKAKIGEHDAQARDGLIDAMLCHRMEKQCYGGVPSIAEIRTSAGKGFGVSAV